MLVGGRCRRKTKYAVRIGCRRDGPVDHDALIEQFDIDRLRAGHRRNLSRSFRGHSGRWPKQQPYPASTSVLQTRVLEVDEDLIRVVSATQDTLHLGLLASAQLISLTGGRQRVRRHCVTLAHLSGRGTNNEAIVPTTQPSAGALVRGVSKRQQD